MGKLIFALASGLLLCVSLAGPTIAQTNSEHLKGPSFIDTEFFLRRRATKLVMPEFPDQAKTAGVQGLVDLAVEFDGDGNFSRIEIAKSPDPLISQAVVYAVKQWQIRPHKFSNFADHFNLGELRFYFVIKDGVPKVENPSKDEQKTIGKDYEKMELSFRRVP